jgi:hypothetical protein
MMRKLNIPACLLLLAATSAHAWTPMTAAQPKDKPSPKGSVAQTMALLQQPFDTKNFRLYMNVGNVLDLLPDNLAKQKIPLKIVVDWEAFQKEHQGVGSPFDEHLQFPADDSKMTVAEALRFALSYLPDDNAAIVPRPGYVLVTTKSSVSIVPQLKERVQATLDGSLATALEQLAELTGTCIVVAPQAAKQAQQHVSVVFRNDVTLAAALRVLTTMTDLTMVVQEGVLLVTTLEHAKALAKPR